MDEKGGLSIDLSCVTLDAEAKHSCLYRVPRDQEEYLLRHGSRKEEDLLARDDAEEEDLGGCCSIPAHIHPNVGEGLFRIRRDSKEEVENDDHCSHEVGVLFHALVDHWAKQ